MNIIEKTAAVLGALALSLVIAACLLSYIGWK